MQDQDDAGSEIGPPQLIRAAQYLRKSTDRQEFSTALQSAANYTYAASHGMQIVRTYADEGKSGLSIGRRETLKQMLADVQSGRADFSAILVYDVSRWGRFQDIDESGYHEYICKRAGVCVHYCCEQFVNDGSPLSAIVKNIKRAMAGEYSRELSTKVFNAHARLVTYGYSQGGAASYGLRRLLLSQGGAVKFELRPGDRKNIQTDRVVWTQGPPEEVEAISWIFQTFVHDRRPEPELARTLNDRGIQGANGRKWTSKSVRRVLCNERYAGNYVWNRVSTRLGSAPVRNVPDTWIRADGVIAPIVARPLFDAAQEIIDERKRKLTLEEKLAPLRRLLREHGRLTGALIQRARGVPSVSSYFHWFGGLIPAYRMVGFIGYRAYPHRIRSPRSQSTITASLSDDQLLSLLRSVLNKHGFLNHRVINEAEGVPNASTYAKRFGSIKRAYEVAGFSGDLVFPGLGNSPEARRALTSVLSDTQMLEALRHVLRKQGKLTRKIIDKSSECPNSGTYLSRFGSIEHAYRLIGYQPNPHRRSCVRTRRLSNEQMLDALRNLRRKCGLLSPKAIDQSEDMPSSETYRRRFGSLKRAFALVGC